MGDRRVGRGREAAPNAVDHQEQLLVGTGLLNPPFPRLSLIFAFIPVPSYPTPPVGSSSLP